MEAGILFSSFTSHLSRLLLVVFPTQIPGTYGRVCVWNRNKHGAYITLHASLVQPQQFSNIQDLLFARISSNYVKVLSAPVDLRWKDAFFKVRNSNRCKLLSDIHCTCLISELGIPRCNCPVCLHSFHSCLPNLME